MLELIKEALEDPTLVMLCIAAAVSLVLGIYENPTTGWIEGTAILAAVVIVVMVASLNDYQKEKQFRKLNEKKDSRVRSCAEHYLPPHYPAPAYCVATGRLSPPFNRSHMAQRHRINAAGRERHPGR